MAESVRYEDRMVDRIARIIEEMGFGLVLDEDGSMASPGYVFMVTADRTLTNALLVIDLQIGITENSIEINGDTVEEPISAEASRLDGVEEFVPLITGALDKLRAKLDAALDKRLELLPIPGVTQGTGKKTRG